MNPKLLLFAVLAVFTSIPALADDSWMVAVTDKAQYHTGESMEISGYIVDRKMPVIAVSIFDPDGEILSANSVELQDDDGFAKTISLDSPFYDKSGTYLIKFDYGQKTDQLGFDVIGSIIPEIPELPEIKPEILALATNKNTYSDNEFITISGTVSAIGDPTILVGIYDKNDFPTGFYTPQINSDLQFSTSFLAKSGVNFKAPGKYYVKAHYGESKETASFEFAEPQQNSNQSPSPVPKPQPQTVPQVTKQKQETKPAELKPQKQEPTPVREVIKEREPIQEQDNLSVEDKQLGEMLNEITLNCDYSEYTDSIIYYDGMGPALMRLCNYDQAIKYFDKSLIREPQNVEVITNKATAFSKLGRMDMALEHYDSALKIKPDYAPALNNKANALAQMGKLEEAILIYNSILEENPTYLISQDNLEKANESLVDYAKSRISDEPRIKNLGAVADTEVAASIAEYDEEPKQQTNIIEHIGSIFAGIFGFLS